jgi:predicted signal transduction protein with EAL and GGDEF domain
MTSQDIRDVISIAQKMEKETLVRWIAHEVGWLVPSKVIADSLGVALPTYNRTVCFVRDQLNDIRREVK